MIKVFYTKPNCPTCPTNYNKGQEIEWKIAYDMTGTPSKANNKKAEQGGDIGDWQVKSPKASLTGKDNCNGYIFGFADTDYYYQMTKAEFEKFCNEFTYIDHDSKTKATKLRIKNDSKKMREWLERATL